MFLLFIYNLLAVQQEDVAYLIQTLKLVQAGFEASFFTDTPMFLRAMSWYIF